MYYLFRSRKKYVTHSTKRAAIAFSKPNDKVYKKVLGSRNPWLVHPVESGVVIHDVILNYTQLMEDLEKSFLD